MLKTLSRFDDVSLCINPTVFNRLIATLRDYHGPNRITVSHSHLSPFMKPSLGLGFDLHFLLGYRADHGPVDFVWAGSQCTKSGIELRGAEYYLGIGRGLMPLFEL